MAPDFIRNNPTLQYDDPTLLAIQVIANMLHRLVQKPPLPPLVSISPDRIPIHNTTNKSSAIVAAVPRLVPKSKLPQHTKLKQRANSTAKAQPIARSII